MMIMMKMMMMMVVRMMMVMVMVTMVMVMMVMIIMIMVCIIKFINENVGTLRVLRSTVYVMNYPVGEIRLAQILLGLQHFSHYEI